jgi:hypothetical protein
MRHDRYTAHAPQLLLGAAGRVASRAGATVLYIDTGTNFSAARLQQLAPTPRTLEQVRCVRAPDPFAAMAVIERVRAVLAGCATPDAEEAAFHRALQLVVVDGVAALFGAVLGRHPSGHALMVAFARALRSVARDHHIAVAVTNTLVGDGARPALGATWAGAVDTRMIITRDHARLVRDPHRYKSSIKHGVAILTFYCC